MHEVGTWVFSPGCTPPCCSLQPGLRVLPVVLGHLVHTSVPCCTCCRRPDSCRGACGLPLCAHGPYLTLSGLPGACAMQEVVSESIHPDLQMVTLLGGSLRPELRGVPAI